MENIGQSGIKDNQSEKEQRICEFEIDNDQFVCDGEGPCVKCKRFWNLIERLEKEKEREKEEASDG